MVLPCFGVSRIGLEWWHIWWCWCWCWCWWLLFLCLWNGGAGDGDDDDAKNNYCCTAPNLLDSPSRLFSMSFSNCFWRYSHFIACMVFDCFSVSNIEIYCWPTSFTVFTIFCQFGFADLMVATFQAPPNECRASTANFVPAACRPQSLPFGRLLRPGTPP